MVSQPFGCAQQHDDALREQVAFFQSLPEVTEILDALPHVLLIINENRQIVFANRYVAEVMHIGDLDSIYGQRPGQLLDCPHAIEAGGCGQTSACRVCGGHKTISFCHQGERATHECRILQRTSGQALDLRVSGSPMTVRGRSFTVLAVTDISHEKRRQALERIFFHDLLNLATGIIGYSGALARNSEGSPAGDAARGIRQLVRQLADQIKCQRELAEAESDELVVHPEPVDARELIESVISLYEGQQASGSRLAVAPDCPVDVALVSDRVLLTRVLGNMVKNALEACGPGEQVTAGCRTNQDAVEFWVHNPAVMSVEVRQQVFQRSFSTKGKGRGLGTYSTKLLTERYLKGRVWFESSAETGTTFHAAYPRYDQQFSSSTAWTGRV